jgi:uncharacterized membrane protein
MYERLGRLFDDITAIIAHETFVAQLAVLLVATCLASEGFPANTKTDHWAGIVIALAGVFLHQALTREAAPPPGKSALSTPRKTGR